MLPYIKALRFILILCLIMKTNSKCNPGQYKRLKGCLDCPTGTYSTEGDVHDCEYCSPGTYASQKGSKFCMPCKAGTFAEYEGASSCDPCPEGTWSNSGSSKCDEFMKEGEGSNFLYYANLLFSWFDYATQNFDNLKNQKKQNNDYYYKPGQGLEINYG